MRRHCRHCCRESADLCDDPIVRPCHDDWDLMCFRRASCARRGLFRAAPFEHPRRGACWLKSRQAAPALSSLSCELPTTFSHSSLVVATRLPFWDAVKADAAAAAAAAAGTYRLARSVPCRGPATPSRGCRPCCQLPLGVAANERRLLLRGTRSRLLHRPPACDARAAARLLHRWSARLRRATLELVVFPFVGLTTSLLALSSAHFCGTPP